MAMKPRDRIDCSAIFDREPLVQPGGQRAAVWVVVNIENWDMEKPMPRTVSSASGRQVHIPDVPNWSWQEFGMQVGFRRFREAPVSPRPRTVSSRQASNMSHTTRWTTGPSTSEPSTARLYPSPYGGAARHADDAHPAPQGGGILRPGAWMPSSVWNGRGNGVRA